MKAPRPLSIPRVSGLSRDRFMSDHVVPCRPVVLADAAAAWRHEFSLEALKTLCGDRTLCFDPVAGGERPEHEAQEAACRGRVAMKLGEYIDSLGMRAATHRLIVRELDDDLPELARRFDQHPFYDLFDCPKSKLRRKLWISPVDTVNLPLHQDVHMDNLNAVVQGKRRFILISPEFTKNLYVSHWGSRSEVSPLAPDLDRFPKFAAVTYYDTTIEAGDILYIPPYWWHTGYACELSVNINAFARLRLGHRRSRAWQASRGFPFKERAFFFAWSDMDPLLHRTRKIRRR